METALNKFSLNALASVITQGPSAAHASQRLAMIKHPKSAALTLRIAGHTWPASDEIFNSILIYGDFQYNTGAAGVNLTATAVRGKTIYWKVEN